MAYDLELAQQIRRMLAGQPQLTERVMFGGIAFMLRGNMVCGVIDDTLMVRVGPAQHAAALREAHVQPFDLTGRPMKGWVTVNAPGLANPDDLTRWVQRGIDFALTLPAK